MQKCAKHLAVLLRIVAQVHFVFGAVFRDSLKAAISKKMPIHIERMNFITVLQDCDNVLHAYTIQCNTV